MSYDGRVQWIQNRVHDLLTTGKPQWNELIARDDGKAATDIKAFLDSAPVMTSLYFYAVDEVERTLARKTTARASRKTTTVAADDSGEGGGDIECKTEGEKEKKNGGNNGNGEPPPNDEPADAGGVIEKVKQRLYMSSITHPRKAVSKDCVYFLKLVSVVNITGKVLQEEMGRTLIYGHLITTSFMKDLKMILKDIYVPAAKEKPADGIVPLLGPSYSAHHREEISASLQRYTTQVSQAVVQVYGNVNIKIPQLESLDNVTPGLVQELEQAVAEWTRIVDQVLRDEEGRQRESKYPMAHIDFWRDRSSSVSTLYEQLQLPAVKRVIMVLEMHSSQVITQYQEQFADLQKLHVEAKDNLKFLTTLERHFKYLATGSMQTIVETLPGLLNAIRMVWIISRYLNSEEYMEPLMKSVADQIADKVEEQINVSVIFSMDPAKAKDIIMGAKSALDKWESAYLTTREKIEESGTDHRWEFERSTLFGRTRYMSKICKNLYDIACVLDQFYKFLGKELKEVTGDTQGIDALIKEVQSLTAEFRSVPYVFEDRFHNTWDNLVAKFRDKVEPIENEAIAFLDKSFQNLRSAEGAFQLLQNFKNIESRERINKKMNEKFVDILTQYGNEVRRMRQLFQKGKDEPPIFKNMPLVAGSIQWARSLFYRVKRPVLAFNTMPHLMQAPEGLKACEDYIDLGKEILEHETNLFDKWQAQASDVAVTFLKNNILGRKGHKFFVNFSDELSELIREAKYLDQLGGFDVPQTVLNVALQQDKYKEFMEQLNLMLASYESTVGDLPQVQRKLLSKQIMELDSCLARGQTPLNWNSLGIADFIEEGNRAIARFKSIRSQVEKSQERIETVVEAIERSDIVRSFDWKRTQLSDPQDPQEFYEFFERHRVQLVEDLVKKYESLGPFLIKIEETTVGTKTGAAASMVDYYHYWEKRVFNAITSMLIRGMAVFEKLFDTNSAGKSKRPPLMRIKADFNPPDAVVGALHGVFKMITKLLQNILQTANHFIRWLDGSCILVPPQTTTDEEKQIFTFYRDIYQNPALIEMTMNIQNSIQKVFQVMNKFFRSWKRYDTQWGLWDPKRKAELEKIAEKKPTVVFFDVYIQVYKSLADSLSNYPNEKDIGFVRIDSIAVISGIRNQALDRMAAYGSILRQLAKRELEMIKNEIKKFHGELQETCEDLEKLKACLGTITTIKSMSMNQEIRIMDVQERYRTLQLYNCEVDSEEVEDAVSLTDKWQELKDQALTKDRRMVHVKIHFSEVTQEQVEAFTVDCKELYRELKMHGPGAPDIDLEDGVELMKKCDVEVKLFQRKREELVKAQTLFALPIKSYPELNMLEKELRLLRLVYDVYLQHYSMVQEFSSMLWIKLDFASLQKSAENFDKKTRRMPKDTKELGELSTFHKLEELVSDFKASVPLIQSLKHDSIKPQHWKELMSLSGQSFELDLNKMSLSTVFALELHRFRDEVNEIVVTAQNELKIETELSRVESHWRNQLFEMAPYKADRGHILRPNEELKTTLEDHILTLQTMASSKYAAKLLDGIKKWERNLNTLGEVFDAWQLVQRKWMYLESIFLDSDDIRLQLPEEAKQFDKIHKTFKGVMELTHQNPNALGACCQEGRLAEFKRLTAEFDKIQKSLTDYLDAKRSLFPRFYLISDDELLSILGSSDVMSIQPHMIKLFDNCKQLILGRAMTATEMVSEEGESFEFHVGVKIEGAAVEEWLGATDMMMQDTLQRITKTALFLYATEERLKWVQSYCGMVAILCTQIWWTWQVEDSFRLVNEGDKNAMKAELVKESAQLAGLVDLVRTSLPKLQRLKVNTLIILDVHARDIVDRFVRDSILSKEEFAWESQLRFYWDRKTDDVVVKQCTGTLRYTYEYQGLNGRLVITPLTDRCVMTLTTALTFNLGGAPAGPAGTGKTETVKDLAKSLAVPCIVTNCGDGLDYKAMGNIFSGLAETGFWGCFDEFNRINPEVLSVVAAQIKVVQLGLAHKKKTIDLLGRDVALKPTIGYFVTMNPGYAGRSELPDNLKALFRPVVMIVPDLLMICENMLMSEGFNGAKVLAKKMTVLYKLASGQLSKQYHYDFQLRALKSVLVMAGDLKRKSLDLPEDVVLMRALRDMNMPKFVKEDVPLFQGLLQDLFPGLDCPRVGYPELKVAIEEHFEEQKMKSKYEDIYMLQMDKVVQLYETMLTRHSTMIVGPTLAGKSVVIDCLASAQKKAFNLPTKLLPINPKAITTDELYGILDPATRDWTDGLLSKIFREMNLPVPAGKDERRYIVYDGDVDAIWIENMNSVMDDNKLLTLTNGERIRLEKHCAMLFEVFDLQYASPATVSRCGMVYVDEKNLGPGPFYDRWARMKTNDKLREILDDLYDKYIVPLITLVFENGGEPLSSLLPRSTMGTDSVIQFAALFDSIVDDNTSNESIENVFIFCLIWSLGSVLDEPGRAVFDESLKKLANKTFVKKSLFDSFLNVEDSQWVAWEEQVPVWEPPADITFNKILVPSVDTTRYAWLLKQFISKGKPTLFIGESGTAKSVTIQAGLENLPSESNTILNINFSSRTSSLDFQRTVEDNISKRTGRIFGPEAGKKLHIFIDDLSMPKIDRYGTQQPLALLRFLIERQYVFQRGQDLEKMIIQDCEFISAMQPPGSGRNSIDPRVVSLYACMSMTFPSNESVERIFVSILKHRFADFTSVVQETSLKIPQATMTLHQAVIKSLPPTPQKFHYIFSLRDLSRVHQGMWQADPQVINTGSTVVRLWRNECLRVYEDRLNAEADKQFVSQTQLTPITKKTFASFADAALVDPIIFGDFRDALDILTRSEMPWDDPRLYEDLVTWAEVEKILKAILENYNLENAQMNLVFFIDAISHMIRIHRIIRLPRGHGLLVGIGGSGKQSLTRLATYTAGYTLFEITLCRGYGDENMREDLKVLFSAAIRRPASFLFTDSHVKLESFLEYMNNILTVGMVPALFGDDEKEPLIQTIRSTARSKGVQEHAMWSYALGQLKDNVHMCLAMSPAGEVLRTRCRNFPGMVSCCTVDWFFSWPADALLAVADFYLHDVELPEESRQNINEMISKVHTSVTMEYSPEFEAIYKRRNFATPKNYLDYLSNYMDFLQNNRNKLEQMSVRLGGGLEKLIQAAEQVAVMSKELATKKAIVDQNAIAVASLIDEINDKTAVASKRQEEANAAAKQIEEDNIIIVREKGDADEALAAALPALDMAAKALEELDKKDLTEIKSMASPPPPVMIVCMCVVILRPLGKEDEAAGWAGAKAMLSDTSILRALQDYKKDDMKERQIKKINDLLNKEAESFEGENMKKKSKAGYGLLQWVKAMCKYYEVLKTVEPKKKLVSELQRKKDLAEVNLSKINKELKELSEKLATLTTQEKEQSAKLKELKEEAETMQRRLEAASQLIEGLGSERERWGADLGDIGVQKERLVGDCLLCAAFVSYCGPFNHKFRTRMVYEDWKQMVEGRSVTMSKDFRLDNLLTSDVEIAAWGGFGLPSDELSVQNGILVSRSARYPLCIDPQMQAVNWIKRKEAKIGLTVKTFNDDFIKMLELAINYGKPFLFENLDEELDPMIDPILEKAFVVVNGVKMVSMGDNQIEVNDDFRLLLSTKLSNPKYTPEVMGKVSIVNCVITLDGLAAQLLNVVVGFERNDLEQMRLKLVSEMSENRQVLKTLEDTLLRELAMSKGSILDNEELINVLNTAKKKSVEIGESLTSAKKTSEEIEKTRQVYQKVSKRGSILYFAMCGMSAISDMYEYSLSSYLVVFDQALAEAKPDRIIDNRLKNIREKLTQTMYDYTCMGIFECHKLLFSFQMTTMIMEGDGELVQAEFDFYMKGNPSLEAVKEAKPHPWISDNGWKDLTKLTTLNREVQNLTKSIKENGDVWKAWYDGASPESDNIPCGFDDIGPFKQLLIIRCFRPDRIVNATKNFIVWRLNDYYVQPPSLVYDKILAQSNEKSPIVFILSPGADPLADVQKLSEQLGYSGAKFKFVSLGQGMGPVAQSNIEIGCQRGHWVMLQNCHLLASWLRTLEKILEGMHKPHKDFRLWLTTMPTEAFPMGILQQSLKVVTEPPDGVKLNMRQSYAKITDEDMNECPHWAFKPLIFVLAFFHAVVQDRRKFGKIGWNVNYDFNESDFNISFRLQNLYLTKCFNQGEAIPWETLRYLIGEAMYGGRVTDQYDRRVVNTYLEEYMGDFIFDENVAFYFSQQGYDYDCPRTGTVNNFQARITALPMYQTPGVFGLHPNAEINYFTNAAKDMWFGLLSMQTGVGGAGTGMSKEDYIKSTADGVMNKIPDEDMKFQKNGVPTPTEVVLMQEVERYQRLTNKMYASLVDLKRALKGEIGMSQDLDDLGQGLYNAFVPEQWIRLAPMTQKPIGSWVTHYVRRHEQYTSWIANGDPAVFWLSGLHVPESLLSALVQASSRRRGWALDKTTLYTVCTKKTSMEEVTEKLLDGANIIGIYLEGARWDIDKVCLARQNPKELIVPMPIIEVIPVEANRLKLRNSLPTPVYVTQARRNAMGVGLVFEANLSTKEHPSIWVLQGVAMVLNNSQ
eukprot:GEMP01000029.1.p1 GENE.GEMP01000029.1~~GEMP01000029.1.p1  ORF type:complete len:4546 (+),score=1158.20 GEMP01000029.1:32-13639(+)